MNVPAALRHVGRGLRALPGLPAVLRLYGRGLALVFLSAPLAGGAYLVLLAVLSLLPVLQVWLTKLLLDAHCGRGRWRSGGHKRSRNPGCRLRAHARRTGWPATDPNGADGMAPGPLCGGNGPTTDGGRGQARGPLSDRAPGLPR